MRIFFYTLLGMLSIISFLYMTVALAKASANYELESKCVQRYISKGIERRDIKTGDGTCSVIRH